MFRTVRRHSILERAGFRSLAVHMPASVLLGTAYLFYLSGINLLYEDKLHSFEILWGRFANVAFESFHIPLILYWATVTVYDALTKYASHRPRESIDVNPLDKPARRDARKPGQIVVKEFDRVHVLREEEIDWIEAADYYAKIHVGKRSYLVRQSLNSLENSLLSDRFLRSHRSAIVNLTRMETVGRKSGGSHIIVLRDGTEVKLSKAGHSRLRKILRKPI